MSRVRWFPAERSQELTALSQRVRDSFLGRSVLRFVRMEGFDRGIVLSAQVFTALIPLFIIVASAAPAGQEDVISQALIRRFALTGDSAAAVEQLFTHAPGASSSVTVFSAFLLLYSGVAFTRRLQRMYRAAWEQEKVGLRSTVFATLGLLALIVEVVVAYGIRALRQLASRSSGSGRCPSRQPPAWCSGRRSPTCCWTARCIGAGCWSTGGTSSRGDDHLRHRDADLHAGD